MRQAGFVDQGTTSGIYRALLLVWACLLCLPCGLVGCYSIGKREIADEKIISQIKPGVSTKADVEQLLGKPAIVDFTDFGLEKWVYQYVKTQPSGASFVPIVGMFAGPHVEQHYLTILFEKEIVKNLGKGETDR